MKCSYVSIDLWPTYIAGDHTVIVASDECKKAQGLQYEKSFPPRTLILFPYVSPGEFFHTKNCCMPIDILALNGINIVLKVWTVFPGLTKIGPMPRGTTKVVEARSGWASKKGIGIGKILPI